MLCTCHRLARQRLLGVVWAGPKTCMTVCVDIMEMEAAPLQYNCCPNIGIQALASQLSSGTLASRVLQPHSWAVSQ